MSYLSILRESLNRSLQQLEDEFSSESNTMPHLLEARSFRSWDDANGLPS
jgi:hypothetical protein